MLRVSLDVRRVARNIRNGEEFRELPDDAVFMVRPVVAHFLNHLGRRDRSWLLPHRRTHVNGGNQSNRNGSQRFSPVIFVTASLLGNSTRPDAAPMARPCSHLTC